MPGSCQRLRLPSLATTIKSQKSEYSPLRKEQRRIVVMGSAKVGKTSIITQFLYDKYSAKYRETVEELHRGEYELPDGASLTLDILDTSGAFPFPAMRALSISTGGAFLLVYSINDEETWKEVEKLREQIIEARGCSVPIVVVGNKSDLPETDRIVQREIIESIVTVDWECGYVECSAKENIAIIEVFKELLVQAKIRYNLSPAVRRRRLSLPSYSAPNQKFSNAKYSMKRHSCTVA